MKRTARDATLSRHQVLSSARAAAHRSHARKDNHRKLHALKSKRTAPLNTRLRQNTRRPGPSATAPYEGVSVRFVAILIDTVVMGAVTAILTAPFFAFSETRLATRAALFGPAVATRALIVLVIYFLYFTLLEGHYGQTVGKMAVKIKVVGETDGSPIDFGEAAVRTVLRIIDGLFVYLVGAILIWSSDKSQRLGDRIAHTVVVKA